MAAPIWRIADAHFRVPYRWPGYFRQRDGWVPGTRTEVPAGAAEGKSVCLCRRKRRIAREVSKPPGSGGTLVRGQPEEGGYRVGGDRTSAGVPASGEGTAVVKVGGGE